MATQVSVPPKIRESTGVASFSASGNEVTAVGPNNTVLGTYLLTRSGTGGSIKFTGADGQASNIVFSASKASNGDVTISGTYNGSAFSSVYTPAGALINRKLPADIHPVDSKLAPSLLHITLPPKPAIRERMAAAGTTAPIVAHPENIHCVLAIVGVVFCAATVETGIAALGLSVAIHTAAFECLI